MSESLVDLFLLYFYMFYVYSIIFLDMSLNFHVSARICVAKFTGNLDYVLFLLGGGH